MTWSLYLSDLLSWCLLPPILLTLLFQHLRYTCPRAFALTNFPPGTHFPQIALRLVPSPPSALGTMSAFQLFGEAIFTRLCLPVRAACCIFPHSTCHPPDVFLYLLIFSHWNFSSRKQKTIGFVPCCLFPDGGVGHGP